MPLVKMTGLRTLPSNIHAGWSDCPSYHICPISQPKWEKHRKHKARTCQIWSACERSLTQ
ncbi:hypothetical protein RSAG8_05827, partial [Rhizoctonia solani AG-8 WAC10335]